MKPPDFRNLSSALPPVVRKWLCLSGMVFFVLGYALLFEPRRLKMLIAK
jgi:hypothetical protein